MSPKNEQKSLLNVLNFDLANFLFYEYKKVNEEEIAGIYCIDYERELKEFEFDIFETIRLRVFSKTCNIENCEHINVSFYTANHLWNIEKINHFVDLLFSIYGSDDNGKGKFNSDDIEDINLNIFNRTWTSGNLENIFTIQITKKKVQGLELHIIFLKNMLKDLGKL